MVKSPDPIPSGPRLSSAPAAPTRGGTQWPNASSHRYASSTHSERHSGSWRHHV